MGCQVFKMLSGTISGMGQLRKSPRKSSRRDWPMVSNFVRSIR
jgi:hypothetical protein